jgi:hypothetical protein
MYLRDIAPNPWTSASLYPFSRLLLINGLNGGQWGPSHSFTQTFARCQLIAHYLSYRSLVIKLLDEIIHVPNVGSELAQENRNNKTSTVARSHGDD